MLVYNATQNTYLFCLLWVHKQTRLIWKYLLYGHRCKQMSSISLSPFFPSHRQSQAVLQVIACLTATPETLNILGPSTTPCIITDWMSSDMFFFPPLISKHIWFLKSAYNKWNALNWNVKGKQPKYFCDYMGLGEENGNILKRKNSMCCYHYLRIESQQFAWEVWGLDSNFSLTVSCLYLNVIYI